MNIKILSVDVLNACRLYDKDLHLYENDELCDLYWDYNHIESVKTNIEFFYGLQKMAKYTEQSMFPYIILNDKEYLKLERYL